MDSATPQPPPPEPTPARGARRTGNVRAGGRSARVVDAVLRTALEVLGEVGYEGLRFEEIARRSEVNKTTIYRRWPTREALVREALYALTRVPDPPITGDIRNDMLAHISAGVAWLATPVGRGIARIIMMGDPDGELRQIIRELRETMIARRIALLEGAVARGELPPGTDSHLVATTLHAGVYSRIVRWGEEVSPALVESIVDLVLAGARAGAAVPRIPAFALALAAH